MKPSYILVPASILLLLPWSSIAVFAAGPTEVVTLDSIGKLLDRLDSNEEQVVTISTSVPGSEQPASFLAIARKQESGRLVRLFNSRTMESANEMIKPVLVGEFFADGDSAVWTDHRSRISVRYPVGKVQAESFLMGGPRWLKDFVARHRDNLKIEEIPGKDQHIATLQTTELVPFGGGRRGIVKVWLDIKQARILRVRFASRVRENQGTPDGTSLVMDFQFLEGLRALPEEYRKNLPTEFPSTKDYLRFVARP